MIKSGCIDPSKYKCSEVLETVASDFKEKKVEKNKRKEEPSR